jgi:phage baseplate assembly protein W
VNARYRGWRFRVPRFDVPGEEVGLGRNTLGAIDTVEDDEAIRQSLLLLITTRPGERVMRPDYGCDLNQLIFSPNDDTTAGLAMHLVRQAVERWEQRVEIVRVDAQRDLGYDPDRTEKRNLDAPMVLRIVLDYRVRATLRADRLVIPVDLQNGGRG